MEVGKFHFVSRSRSATSTHTYCYFERATADIRSHTITVSCQESKLVDDHDQRYPDVDNLRASSSAMGDFLWVNREAGPSKLTSLKDGERKAARSFVQRKRFSTHHGLKSEGPVLPPQACSEPPGHHHSELPHHGREIKPTARSHQASMQASWRLGKSTPPLSGNSVRNKRRVLVEKSSGKPTHPHVYESSSRDSQRWTEHESRPSPPMRQTHVVRKGNVCRGEARVHHHIYKMSY